MSNLGEVEHHLQQLE